MCKNNKNHIGVHHGAREIELQALINSIPGIKDIRYTLQQFREVAFNYNKAINEGKINYELYGDRFNNNVSILGNRGMGKSSVLLSTVREISTNNLFQINGNYDNENKIDIINPTIDPEDINENSDILGWVITSLSKEVEKLEKQINTDSLSLFLNYNDEPFAKLKTIHEDLIKCYAIYGKEYSDVALNRSINIYDYRSNLNETLTNDYALYRCFEDYINQIVNIKREINKNRSELLNESSLEPLIYFFFDDVDMSSKKSIKILKDILSFFYHPNIVIFISGDYEVFEQSIRTHFMNETKDITLKMSEERKSNEVKFAKNRAEYFLKKVLPPSYRYYINEIKEESFKMGVNYHSSNNNVFEKKNILQLISYVFYTGFNKNKFKPENDFYLQCFLLPRIFENEKINIKNEGYSLSNAAINTSQIKQINILYAYFSVFSVNIRGFMNVYNYLCKQAINISKSDVKDISEYWDINKFREFLQLIIDSKHTYMKYEENIKKFLSLKLLGLNNDDYTRLRIDCEELELFISYLLKKIGKEVTNFNAVVDSETIYIEDDPDYIKEEIKSLIMLPILFNELFYIIHGKNYEQRYQSIQRKLKDILTKVFINSLNEDIMILPTQLGMRRTLCLFQHITSRMTVASLKNLSSFYDDGYNNANNKKYIVQLYLATIQLGSAGAKKGSEDTQFEHDFYDKYKQSTYIDLSDRLKYEKEIAPIMNKIYRHLDREWLADKIKFAIALEPTINKIEYLVHNQFLELLSSSFIEQEIYDKLDEMYRLIYVNNKNVDDYLKDNSSWYEYYYKILFKEFETLKGKYSKLHIYHLVEQINTKKEFFTAEINEENVFKSIYIETVKRIQNNTTNSPQDIKEFDNLLDDFKIEFEVLVTRLSNLYDDSFDIEEFLINRFEYYYDVQMAMLMDEEKDKIIEESIFDILAACIERDRERVRECILKLIDDLNEALSNLEKNSLINMRDSEINKITNILLKISRNQKRSTGKELKDLEKIIKDCMKCYYLYLFILEAIRISEEPNTKFFNTFRKGIEYGSVDDATK